MMARGPGGKSFSLTVKTGARRRGKAGASEFIAAVVVAVIGVALWRAMSWWIVALVAVPAACWVLAARWSWLHQHRRPLAPVAVGLCAAGLAFASKALSGWLRVDGTAVVPAAGWWVAGVYGAVAVVLLWAAHVTEHVDHRRYFTVCTVVGLGWSAAVQWMPWSRTPDLVAAWLVLVLLAGAFWWTDRRTREQVKVEKKIRSWPELVRGTELAGTHRSQYVEKPEGGWRMRLSWPPGKKMADSVTKLGRLLESVMEAPRRSVTVEFAGDEPNAVIAECSPAGALGALQWDGEVAVSIADVVRQARYGDGTFEQYRRWEPGVGGKHKLTAGATRSGKSVSMKHEALTYGAAEDVVLWLIDLKGGSSLRPLAPLADWFVTSQADAVAMLEAAARLCDARAESMAEWGWDPWRPSREFPVVIIKIDETAKLLGIQAPAQIQSRALAAAVQVGQLGAGLGVLIDPATQLATLEALGSSQFREQLTITECYRMRSEGTAGFFLPNAPAGVEPAHLRTDQKGSHFADIEGEFRPMVAQKFNVTPEQVAEVVTEYWESTPEIEECHRAALGQGWSSRQLWAMVDGKVVRADATDVPMPRDSDSDDVAEDDATAAAAARMVSRDAPQAVSRPVSLSETVPAWAAVVRDMDDEPTFRELVAAEQAVMTPEQRAAEKARLVEYLERTRPTDPAQAPAIVWELLTGSPGGEPVSPGDAQRASGLSESTVHRLLRRWEDEGRVEHVGRGAYRPVERPAELAAAGASGS